MLGMIVSVIVPVPATALVPASVVIQQDSVTKPSAARLDGIVITASRRPQRIADAVVTTEVINRSDIERTGAQDVYTVLMQHTGVQPEMAAVSGGGIQIQGMSSERVLVLVDGQPLIGRIDGQLDLTRIPVSTVERIEVVKGPLSTMYGSSAMGGVINIITRSGFSHRPVARLHMLGGSRDRFETNLAVSGGSSTLFGVLGIGWRQIDAQPGRSEQVGARARRWDADAKGEWRVHDGLSLQAGAVAVAEDQRWTSRPLFFFSDNDQFSGRIGAHIGRPDSRHRFTPFLYYSTFSHLSRRAAVPQPVSDSGDKSREDLWKLDLAYNGAFGAHNVDAGAEIKRERLSTHRLTSPSKTLSSVEPYAQWTINVGTVSLVPGARLMYSDQWGTHFTPKFAVLYRPVPQLALRGSVGMGYRAPEFKELYLLFLNTVGGFSYIVNGNPDLDPETSSNTNLGVEWDGERVYGRVQLFHNRFSKFIENVYVGTEDGVEVYTYGNIDNGVTQGADVQAGTLVFGITLDASYSYLDAKQRGSNQQLLGRPEHSGRFAADYRFPLGIRTGVTFLYTGKTPVARDSSASPEPGGSAAGSAAPATQYREAYARTDVRIARRLGALLDVHGGVQNVFDARPAGWPGLVGRQWYIGATLDRMF